MKKLQRKLKRSGQSLDAFCDYFKYLDMKPPNKMRPAHAQRVVQLHAKDYSREWEISIEKIKTSQDAAESYVLHLNHYTNSAMEHIKTHTKAVELAVKELVEVTREITKDKRILRRYVGLIYGIRRALLLHS